MKDCMKKSLINILVGLGMLFEETLVNKTYELKYFESKA